MKNISPKKGGKNLIVNLIDTIDEDMDEDEYNKRAS